MSGKPNLGIALALAACTTLAACGGGVSDVDDINKVSANIHSQYKLLGNTVDEFTLHANPDKACILVNGYAEDMICLPKSETPNDAPQIYAKYTVAGNKVVEFTPAINPDYICTLADGYDETIGCTHK